MELYADYTLVRVRYKDPVQEVKHLLASGYDGSEPAFQAIGYRQLVEHLRGRLQRYDCRALKRRELLG